MITLYLYKIWCTTENQFVETWAETEPIVCPNNNEHTIDTSKTQIIQMVMDEEVRDKLGKLRVQETSRPISRMSDAVLKTCFVGIGDDPSDITDVGGGTKFIYEHNIGDPLTDSVYIEFNVIENETWIHEGYINWDSCIFDDASMNVVTNVTTVEAGENTYFNLYNGYLVVPASGDGAYNVPAMVGGIGGSMGPHDGLVYIPDDEIGRSATAYWNADWNSETKKFENIMPAPNGDGRYNMFTTEITLQSIVNKVHLLKNGFQMFQSADTEMIGQGMRFKLITNTYEDGNDHDWKITFLMTLYRAKTK